MSSKKPYMDNNYINPKLKSEIEELLEWIKNPYGFSSFIEFYLQQDNTRIISELAKIYTELIKIFTF